MNSMSSLLKWWWEEVAGVDRLAHVVKDAKWFGGEQSKILILKFELIWPAKGFLANVHLVIIADAVTVTTTTAHPALKLRLNYLHRKIQQPQQRRPPQRQQQQLQNLQLQNLRRKRKTKVENCRLNH